MPRRQQTSLQEYRAKRREQHTPEPFGSMQMPATGQLFVVQQHAASHLHFDLRLEVDGVLKSWAVPKGPSANPADKRFAVETEDHPLDYAAFEGEIPTGNYGAGHVIVWDRGIYVPHKDMAAGLRNGKLLFDLQGHKLKGRWTLVRMNTRNTTGREWLLIKERDAYAVDQTAAYDATSVLSGLSVEELKQPHRKTAALKRTAKQIAKQETRAEQIPTKPMLASAGEPSDRKGWLWELKYDGYRIVANKNANGTGLFTRNGQNITERFPEICQVIQHLPVDECVTDGEVVVLDADGRPSFALMQQRAHTVGAQQIARAAILLPATYYCFDLLQLQGYDLRDTPLLERKKLLKRLVPACSNVKYSEHVANAGRQTFATAQTLGIEGVVGKRAASVYRAGRSSDWIKVRAMRSDDFAVIGWSPAKGNRQDIGSIAVAEYDQGQWRYVGHIGSGLKQSLRADLLHKLKRIARKTSAVADLQYVPDREIHWVTPKWVVEVTYTEYTRHGLLRQPSVLRLRDDKSAQECIGRSELVNAAKAVTTAPSYEVTITNPDKVLFPASGLTKSDLVNYYRRISPWILTYLKDRCIVVTRFPDGIEGKSFYQRNVPDYVPKWIRRHDVWSESTHKTIHYFVIAGAEDLAYLANMAVLPIHMWHSRVTQMDRPDWCVLDLDPKQAPFRHVVELAKCIGEICVDIGLPAYPKTSGASGMHVLLPLAGQLDYPQSRTLGELIARLVVHRHPDVATIARSVRARHNKVYVDYLQNSHGQLIAAPFCVRATPEASVSMPLGWHEVNQGLRPDKYRIDNATRRMQRLGADPGLGVLNDTPDLPRCLSKLAELLKEIS